MAVPGARGAGARRRSERREVASLRITTCTVIALLVLGAITPVAVSLSAADDADENTPLAPQIRPAPGPSAVHAILLVQLEHLVRLVLWLSAVAFVAGLLVGAVAQKRASLWAALAVALFLGAVWAIGVKPQPAPIYRWLLLAAGCLVLSAAALGGWAGQQVWSLVLRVPGAGAAPQPPEREC